MSSREFGAWLAYDRVQPVGPRRLDRLFAVLCAVVAGGLGATGATPADYDVFAGEKIAELLELARRQDAPGEPPRRPARSVEQQKLSAIGLTRMLGGTVR